MTTQELDALYKEYHDICDDRGVFAKSRRELHHNDEGKWLRYAIHLIAALAPSREERKRTVSETPDEPFKTLGNI